MESDVRVQTDNSCVARRLLGVSCTILHKFIVGVLSCTRRYTNISRSCGSKVSPFLGQRRPLKTGFYSVRRVCSDTLHDNTREGGINSFCNVSLFSGYAFHCDCVEREAGGIPLYGDTLARGSIALGLLPIYMRFIYLKWR